MREEMIARTRKAGVLTIGVTVLLLNLGGCANDPPKPGPTVTPDQVRSHSDKAFEKLKQEERDRAADPAASGY